MVVKTISKSFRPIHSLWKRLVLQSTVPVKVNIKLDNVLFILLIFVKVAIIDICSIGFIKVTIRFRSYFTFSIGFIIVLAVKYFIE